MLRLIVLLLMLLNAGYFAWSQGMLRAYGWAPVQQQEPQRLQQQIRPEAIRLLSAEEARRAEQAALAPPPPPKPPECLQAGLFDEAQTAPLRQALEAALPSGSWVLEPVVRPALWIVYIGKFSSTASLNRRRAELEKLKLKSEPVEKADLKPGLSLGAYPSHAEAQKALAALQRHGVRSSSLRVVELQTELRQSRLKIPAADEALQPRLEALQPALAGHPLQSCP